MDSPIAAAHGVPRRRGRLCVAAIISEYAQTVAGAVHGTDDQTATRGGKYAPAGGTDRRLRSHRSWAGHFSRSARSVTSPSHTGDASATDRLCTGGGRR